MAAAALAAGIELAEIGLAAEEGGAAAAIMGEVEAVGANIIRGVEAHVGERFVQGVGWVLGSATMGGIHALGRVIKSRSAHRGLGPVLPPGSSRKRHKPNPPWRPILPVPVDPVNPDIPIQPVGPGMPSYGKSRRKRSSRSRKRTFKKKKRSKRKVSLRKKVMAIMHPPQTRKSLSTDVIFNPINTRSWYPFTSAGVLAGCVGTMADVQGIIDESPAYTSMQDVLVMSSEISITVHNPSNGICIVGGMPYKYRRDCTPTDAELGFKDVLNRGLALAGITSGTASKQLDETDIGFTKPGSIPYAKDIFIFKKHAPQYVQLHPGQSYTFVNRCPKNWKAPVSFELHNHALPSVLGGYTSGIAITHYGDIISTTTKTDEVAVSTVYLQLIIKKKLVHTSNSGLQVPLFVNTEAFTALTGTAHIRRYDGPNEAYEEKV